MKKSIAILLSALLLGGALAGCGTAKPATTTPEAKATEKAATTASDDSLENTKWHITGAVDKDNKEVDDSIIKSEAVTYEFKPDNVVSIVIGDEQSTSVDGTWKQVGSDVIISGAGSEVTLRYAEGILVMQNGDYTFTLEKSAE